MPGALCYSIKRSAQRAGGTSSTRWATTAAGTWFRCVVLTVVVGVVVTWMVATDDGPVAAGEASIEVTFTGDEASYDGPREVIEGDAIITFINETTNPVWFVVQRFGTGSDELALLPEGGNFVPGEQDRPSDLVLTRTVGQGPHPVTLTLQPGTYTFETGFEFANLVWRAGVIEVVAD